MTDNSSTPARSQPPIDPEDLDALARASTATITTQLFKHGLRNTNLAGVRPMNSSLRPMIGEAVTLRYIPAREDLDQLEVYDDYDHPQRLAVERTGPGRVLVIDCRGQGRAASAGNILLTRMQVRGAAGFIADGTLRDSQPISELSMPVFAAGASPMTNLAQHHAVDIQVPIACAGVAIYPGDVLVGDADGVVCVPRALVARIAGPAAEQESMEDFILDRIRSGAELRGTYPADERTLAAYRAQRTTDHHGVLRG